MKYSNTHNIEIYRRILKYPPFSAKKRQGVMKIIHHLKNGATVTATSQQYVTVEDAEKLFALIYVMQSRRVLEQKEFIFHNIKTIAAKLYIRDIAKILNTNNYNCIINALKRLTELTIHFSFRDFTASTHLVHEVQYDTSTCQLTVLLNFNFYRACREKSLTINLCEYLLLSPIAKNLYCFIKSNSGTEFTEDLLIERAVIQSARERDARRQLKVALNELKTQKIIKGYTMPRRGLWKIIKTGEGFSPALAE